MVVKTFEDLYIWQQARLVVNRIYKMMNKCRDYGFRDQIQRASISIMNNIAEGFDSGYDTKFLNFLNIANGSCSEVKSMLYLCEDLNLCSSDEREDLQNKISLISAGIIKLRQTLNSRI